MCASRVRYGGGRRFGCRYLGFVRDFCVSGCVGRVRGVDLSDLDYGVLFPCPPRMCGVSGPRPRVVCTVRTCTSAPRGRRRMAV